MNKAICTVYRAFFRYNRQLQAAGQKLEIRTPLDKEAYRTASYAWVVNESGESLNKSLAHKSVYTAHWTRFTAIMLKARWWCCCSQPPGPCRAASPQHIGGTGQCLFLPGTEGHLFAFSSLTCRGQSNQPVLMHRYLRLVFSAQKQCALAYVLILLPAKLHHWSSKDNCLTR